MNVTRALARLAAALLLFAVSPRQGFALPTMIRLGYSDCSGCHISRQGGGPLNAYGRGIDRAQSLRGGEYMPATDDLTRAFTFGGRAVQEFRTVMQEQGSQRAAEGFQARFWPRFSYRNATEVGKGFRVSATITGESNSTLRPTLPYEPPSRSSSVFVNTALLHYRAGPSLELAVGRDQLPGGLNLPDLGSWIKSRNRLGYYDAPVQFKMFWTGPRVRVTPFVYRPGGDDDRGEGESGVGSLAEFVVNRRGTAVVGMSILDSAALNGDRRTLGGYARLGFGRWGILAEHDLTERTRAVPSVVSFAQHASYGHLFWAVREWLVASLIGERLYVEKPFEERQLAARVELVARLASEASVSVNARRQRDQITGRVTTSVVLQAAFKTFR